MFCFEGTLISVKSSVIGILHDLLIYSYFTIWLARIIITYFEAIEEFIKFSFDQG